MPLSSLERSLQPRKAGVAPLLSHQPGTHPPRQGGPSVTEVQVETHMAICGVPPGQSPQTEMLIGGVTVAPGPVSRVPLGDTSVREPRVLRLELIPVTLRDRVVVGAGMTKDIITVTGAVTQALGHPGLRTRAKMIAKGKSSMYCLNTSMNTSGAVV